METRTNGMANFVSVYTHAIANPELRDKYEYMRSAEMDYNSRLRLAEDKAHAEGRAEGKAEGRAEGKAEGKIEGTIETLVSIGMNHSQILSWIQDAYKLTTDEAECCIKQVFSKSNNAQQS